jgi:PhnB protein
MSPDEEVAMPDVQPVPERLHTITPRLVFTHEAAAALKFYEGAFGAETLEEPFADPEGNIVHAEMRIGDSVVFVTDEGDGEGVAPASVGGQVTAVMALNVPDVDALWARAVGAGCEVVYPLADQFYGDRGGRLRDPFGHQWMLSTHIEDVDRDELDRRMQPELDVVLDRAGGRAGGRAPLEVTAEPVRSERDDR